MIETSIVIPSYRRPAGLEQTILSVLDQKGLNAPFEIVVIDNDADRSAEAVTAGLAPRSPVPIRYVSEPRPGISHARNAGVAAVSGTYLAFLDDDEQVEPDWLATLLSALRRFGADAAVGPVYPRFPAGLPVDAYRRAVYTRDALAPTGTALLRWNIGNSIFVRERCFATAEPFDPRLGLTGGEDTVFMRQMTRRGRRLVWCAEAAAWETVPADRLDAQYLIRRMFRGAQTTTYVCTAVRPRELGRAARLMAVGGAQIVLWGPAALVLRLCNHAGWLPAAAKAAAGLGKLLWHPRLHLRLYR
jgi:cellulose synthase/poly-beta-1,6-N-acetylglucosamine synthase-like glycosyltransferase